MSQEHPDAVKQHTGWGGTLLPAFSEEPFLSIHVPQFHSFPPTTNPLATSSRALTSNPGAAMSPSRPGPAFRCAFELLLQLCVKAHQHHIKNHLSEGNARRVGLHDPLHYLSDGNHGGGGRAVGSLQLRYLRDSEA